MDWKSVINVVAPTLATALGGPLAGLAVEAIGDATGMSEPTVEKVKKAFSEGQLTTEQVTKLREAETSLKLKMRELDITEEQINANDRDSARKMQTSTQSVWPGILACSITVGFFGILCFILVEPVPESSRDVVNIMLGSLGTAWISVISYYFGSSVGSGEKTRLLAQSKKD